MKLFSMTWSNVIFHPDQTTFEEEFANAAPKKATSRFGIGILIAAFISGVSTFVYETFFNAYVGSRQALAFWLMQNPAEKSAIVDFVGSPIAGGLFSFLGFLIGAPIIILIGIMLSLWLAKMLGGKGNLEKHTFSFALFIPSLIIVANAFGVIRQIGVCVASPILWVYAIILSVIAVKSVHGLSTAKSLIAVIVPFIVSTVIAMIISPPHL
jgi:hypothetical protein